MNVSNLPCDHEICFRDKEILNSKQMKKYLKQLELNMIEDYTNLFFDSNVEEDMYGQTLMPIEDLHFMVNKMDSFLPKNDHMSSWTRSKLIDWHKVAFGDYSEDQCRLTWESIMNKQRHYRNLSEVIAQVKVQMPIKEPICESSMFVRKADHKRKSQEQLATTFDSLDQIFKPIKGIDIDKLRRRQSLPFSEREMQIKKISEKPCKSSDHTISEGCPDMQTLGESSKF